MMKNAGLYELCNYIEDSNDDFIDQHILKSMIEENCCCPVCQETCYYLSDKCECSLCNSNMICFMLMFLSRPIYLCLSMF